MSRFSEVQRAGPGQGQGRRAIILLGLVALCATIFRGAYEQLGNTVALWADSGIDRHVGTKTIPMTWFQSLNPLLVIVLTPPLLAMWQLRAARGHISGPCAKMATGALIAAGAYLLLAAISAIAGGERVSWIWLLLFFVVMTAGELFILPTGLGLFGRLAPAGYGATATAAWFFAIFTGNLVAGSVGILWERMNHAAYFTILALLSLAAMILLRMLDRPVQQALEAAETA